MKYIHINLWSFSVIDEGLRFLGLENLNLKMSPMSKTRIQNKCNCKIKLGYGKLFILKGGGVSMGGFVTKDATTNNFK